MFSEIDSCRRLHVAMIFPGKMLSDEGEEAILFDLLNNYDAEAGVDCDTTAL